MAVWDEVKYVATLPHLILYPFLFIVLYRKTMLIPHQQAASLASLEYVGCCVYLPLRSALCFYQKFLIHLKPSFVALPMYSGPGQPMVSASVSLSSPPLLSCQESPDLL